MISVVEDLSELLLEKLAEQVAPRHKHSSEMRADEAHGEGSRRVHVVASSSFRYVCGGREEERELNALEDPVADGRPSADVPRCECG
jgi:hypothetical protein